MHRGSAVSLYARLALLAVAVAAVFALGWKIHHSGAQSGRAEVQAKWNAEKMIQQQALADANATARAKERDLQVKAMEAINAATERAKVNARARDAARRDADSLRSDLAAARSDLSGASCGSVREHAATLNTVFGECTAEVEGLAGAATGHAVDSLMLQEAWPK